MTPSERLLAKVQETDPDAYLTEVMGFPCVRTKTVGRETLFLLDGSSFVLIDDPGLPEPSADLSVETGIRPEDADDYEPGDGGDEELESFERGRYGG